MKKRTKRFLGTLAIIGVFAIGTVFGAEVLLKFTGTSTIDEAKKLIQDRTEGYNTLISEYNKLDKVATDEITSLKSDINSLKVEIETLTQERDELQTKYNELSGCEPHSTIVSLQNKIKSLEDEIARKDDELKAKDRLLEQKDEKIKYYENTEPTKEIARLRTELETANNKCEELQNIIGDSKEETKTFTKSDLVKDGE